MLEGVELKTKCRPLTKNKKEGKRERWRNPGQRQSGKSTEKKNKANAKGF